jgi:hypothetical protein
MTAVEHDQLNGGACLDLPLAVVDKYFMADPFTERFQHLTAKAICGRCAVRAACLADAIRLPGSSGTIRGGESGTAIQALHRRYLGGEASAEALAAQALLRQRPLGGITASRSLRAGQFEAAELLSPLSD